MLAHEPAEATGTSQTAGVYWLAENCLLSFDTLAVRSVQSQSVGLCTAATALAALTSLTALATLGE